ncbi:MotA/TolQ/ExbB proton channel family protein [Sulfuriroseicoccus oceanibius]|uniref:MotA/TolQ/ExbB proton channel family protein n=1 Tax=Sulfuriroseicoccus oceanibius TaxID=2707525 RepID=A0A6B3LAI1_9BACT|nr:MotA/TolQ/ExbB proton channel family protein [Sulfuriroseicoccus oceanibius]QQL43943.1 MotA/TolQ/ExbB proton channel family protein [Sulfuriroseicoccus oceanibius]
MKSILNSGKSSLGYASSAITFAVLSATQVLAQDEEGAEAAAEELSMFDNIVQNGGPFIWVLAALSLCLIGLAVFNAMALRAQNFTPADLRVVMLDHMANCRVRSAIEVANSSPSFFGRMMAHALPHVDATRPEDLGNEAVEDAMAEFTIDETRAPMTWVNYFNVITQAAPMLGLLGTVSGMVSAFAKLGKEADPSMLAGNISEALFTTMGGLIIAIPSLFCFYFFRNRLQKLVAESHQAGREMMEASIQAVNADQQMAKVPEGLHAE